MTGSSPEVRWHAGQISRDRRWALSGGAGSVVWLTGLSGSGKSTVAVELEKLLVDSGRSAYLLDGDNLRHGLNGDLGFSDADRTENVRRVAEVALLFADAGIVAVAPLISPFAADRAAARHRCEDAGIRFVEVYVNTPLEICEQRDPKGLYAKARSGVLAAMTGIDSPYEEPVDPDVELRADGASPAEMARRVLDAI
ncbi:MAG: adenylyl-sulfate kinase [Microthrixaceae bacterium]